MTTDGVVASWHLKKATTKATKKSTKKHKCEQVHTLHPKLYGTHGVDVIFELDGPINVIAVDPGHVELIHSVRSHRTVDAITCLHECLDHLLPTDELSTPNGKGKRRLAKHRLLAEKQLSTFRLTNRQWAHETGRLTLRENTHRLHRSLNLQESIDILSRFTSKTTSSASYLQHASARVDTAPAFLKN